MTFDIVSKQLTLPQYLRFLLFADGFRQCTQYPDFSFILDLAGGDEDEDEDDMTATQMCWLMGNDAVGKF